MEKNAPSDFTRALHSAISGGLKNHVPLDFIVVNLEITKIDLANRFINQQAVMRAQSLAAKMANENTPIHLDTDGKIIAHDFGRTVADAIPRMDKPIN